MKTVLVEYFLAEVVHCNFGFLLYLEYVVDRRTILEWSDVCAVNGEPVLPIILVLPDDILSSTLRSIYLFDALYFLCFSSSSCHDDLVVIATAVVVAVLAAANVVGVVFEVVPAADLWYLLHSTLQTFRRKTNHFLILVWCVFRLTRRSRYRMCSGWALTRLPPTAKKSQCFLVVPNVTV